MQRMNSLLSGIARTFSSNIEKAERQSALRSVPSFNDFESHSSADVLEQQQHSKESGVPPPLRCQSLPSRFAAPHLHTAGSVTDSESSFAVGSPMAGSTEWPTAAEAAEAGAAKQRKRPYKINGMDAYDYWSLIKSL